jgi:hypothetical protein
MVSKWIKIKIPGIMQLRYIHPILGDYIANSAQNVSLAQQFFDIYSQKYNNYKKLTATAYPLVDPIEIEE